MSDKLYLKIIVEHFQDQKWFTDAIAAHKATQDRRNRRAAYVASRFAEFVGKPNRPEIEKAIGEEFDKKEA